MGIESIAAPVIGAAASSIFGGGGSGSSNQQASQAGTGQSWADIQKANELNKQNATWSQQQNQSSVDKALGQNRVNQTSDFGGITWEQDPTTGAWSQSMSLAPDQQGMLDALRGKQGSAINNLDTSGTFNVNSDYMNALKAQLQPGLDTARNTENARLAAMGLSSGSGEAWGTSQDALNRSSNDANQKAVLGGFDAYNTTQNQLRSNLGALNSTETGWKNNSSMPSFAQATAPQMGQITVNAPTNDLSGAMAADSATEQADKNKIAALLGKAGTEGLKWWNNAGSSSMPSNWSGDYYSNPNNDSYGW